MEAEERIVRAERHDGHLKSLMAEAVEGKFLATAVDIKTQTASYTSPMR
jgi:hypothetical protein